MITSRGLTVFRITHYAAKNLLVSNLKNNVQKQITRGGHGGEYYYRRPAENCPKNAKLAEALGGALWWWVTWHFLTDYHEFFVPDLPDPATFTDEELGIPPDDAD